MSAPTTPTTPPAGPILFAGGGTAGHVLPGLAVATELSRRGWDRGRCWFVVSRRGQERRLVTEAGFPASALPGRGIQRSLTAANLGAVVGLLRAFVQAVALLRALHPSLVVVLGGFASAPAAAAAALWRVPVVVVEQNARAGLVSRLAGRVARASALPFAATDLPRGAVTGNPVRGEILAIERGRDRVEARVALGLPVDRIVVAAFAGSLGARRINLAVAEAAERWADRGDLAIHHVVGSRASEDALVAEPEGQADRLWYRTVPYEERMDLLLAAADVVVCRAGGTTVAELAAVGVPALLVPLPSAPRDHQTANAAELRRAGGALVVPDGELDGERLVAEVEGIVAEPGRLEAMAAAAASVGRRDAAERVADLLERLVEEHRRG